MKELSQESMYKPYGIWEPAFCKHCGKEAKKEYVLDGYDSGYQMRCDCDTVSRMVENLQEQGNLARKIEQLKQEHLKLSKTYSEEYKEWYVRKALEDAARSVGLDSFEIGSWDNTPSN